jgi:hypothetical protein
MLARTLHIRWSVPLLHPLVFSVGLSLVCTATVGAVTLDEIIALTKAGVSDSVILALIDRDKTIFAVELDQLVRLQREGVREAVILAMLKSGRAEGDAQARADSAQKADMVLSTLSTVPEVVLLGHGPDYPNVAHHFYSSYPLVPPLDLLPVPYPIPYGVPYVRDHGVRRHPRNPIANTIAPARPSPALCIAHITTGPAPAMVGSKGFVTVCPEPLQPK